VAQNIVEIGDVHVRIPVDNSGGDGPGHTEGGGMAEAADGGGRVRVQVPIDDGGGAATVQTEEGSDVAKKVADTGDVLVQTHIDEGGGAVQVTERGDVTKDWFDHTAVDEEVDMTQVVEDRGDDDVQIPVNDVGGGAVLFQAIGEADVAKVHEGDVVAKNIDNEHDDQVPVAEGAELTKIEVTLAREEAENEFMMANQGCFAHGVDVVGEVAVIKNNTSGDAIPVEDDEGAELIEENFEGVQVSVEIKPEEDKDEEGGGEVPTLDDKEGGRLGSMMTKQGCFAHGGEGGVAKSTQPRSCAFLLVVNAGKFGPHGRSQAHLTAATCSDNNTG
jgi:hypothetical protein